MYRILTLFTLLSISLVSTAADPKTNKEKGWGGAACVMAKWQGNTLDYVLVYGKKHPVEAQEEGERMLSERGYADYKKHVDIMFNQAVSNLPHAYVIVVKTTYKTKLGKDRTSYGCGFSPKSYADAQWDALRDLQNYSWGWTPSLGFKVVEQLRY